MTGTFFIEVTYMIELRLVDEHNRAAVLALSVAKKQRGLVADNAFSLGQAALQPACVPLAVYADDIPVGFMMYGMDVDDGENWIYRLMTDMRYQGRGYGRGALRLTVARIRAEAPGRDIYISFERSNDAARNLYISEGFLPDGWEIDGETVCRLSDCSLRFRDIAPEDLASIARLSADWARENITWGFCADTPAGLARYRGWAACDGAEIVGYLLGEVYNAKNMTSILPEGTPYFEIEELYVRPEWRSKGVGGRLMKRAQHFLQAEGRVKAILLSTATKDHPQILDFYIRQQGMTFWSARLFKEL